jgi:hypothetical protein
VRGCTRVCVCVCVLLVEGPRGHLQSEQVKGMGACMHLLVVVVSAAGVESDCADNVDTRIPMQPWAGCMEGVYARRVQKHGCQPGHQRDECDSHEVV